MVDIIDNAIQSKAWYAVLPRPEYASLKKVPSSQSWFEIYELPFGIYAIYEPGHFQEIISYLIRGKERSLLLDTGLGIGNIKNIVEELTNSEIIVVNSHTHFDHIGDNHRFDTVHVFDAPNAIERLSNGIDCSSLEVHLRDDSIWKPTPPEFDPKTYSTPPCKFIPIKEGHIFNLGNRCLEIIHTPGHSPDSIMLLDRDNRLLFTGDTLYPAVLYAYLEGSDFQEYLNTMRRLSKMIPEIDTVFCSHNTPVHPPKFLADVAQAFEKIVKKEIKYQLDSNGVRLYQFNGFAITTSDNDPIDI